MRVALALGLTSLFLAACSGKISKAEEIIRNQLIDPASAQFRDVELHSGNGFGDVICGEVNSRNRLGGYVGFRKFFVRFDGEFRRSQIDSMENLTPAARRMFGDNAAYDSSRFQEEFRERCR